MVIPSENAVRRSELVKRLNSVGLCVSDSLDKFLNEMPKVELHLHLAGTLEPELAIKLAAKHGMLPLRIGPHCIQSVDELRALYKFKDLGEFLDLYIALEYVLKDSDDFYRLAMGYLEKAAKNNVRFCEIMVGMQQHTVRGIKLLDLFNSINKAAEDAETKWGIKSKLVAAFSRHFPPGTSPSVDADPEAVLSTPEQANGFFTLSQIINYNKIVKEDWRIQGIGLGGPELAFPPLLWKKVYLYAESMGMYAIAHAGEEGPPQFVKDCIEELNVLRIDHGVRSIEDPELISLLSKESSSRQVTRVYGKPSKICCTVCPMSNFCLKVYPNPFEHPILKMLDAGIMVSLSSDDPPYFGGYLSDNYRFLVKYFGNDVNSVRPITAGDILQISLYGVDAAVLSLEEKNKIASEILQKFNAFFAA